MTNSEHRELLDHLFLSGGVKLPQLPAHSTEASLSRPLYVCETMYVWEDVCTVCVILSKCVDT